MGSRGIGASLLMSTKTFHGVALLLESQAAEIDRLRRALRARGPVQDRPAYSNYLPRWRRVQTRP